VDARELARRQDPETSKAAARSIAPSLPNLQSHAVSLVAQYPGKTARELAEVDPLCAKDPRVLNRRLGEVARKDLIVRGVVRRCGVSGRQAATWWPTSAPPYRFTPGGRRRRR